MGSGQRLGEADEIAKAVVYLAGDDAGFMTGSVATINGSRSMANPICTFCPKIAVLGVRMMIGMTRILIAILTAAMRRRCSGLPSEPAARSPLAKRASQMASAWYQRADSGDFFFSTAPIRSRFCANGRDPTAEVLVLFANRAPAEARHS